MDSFGLCLVLLAMNAVQFPFALAGAVSLTSSFRVWLLRRRIERRVSR